MTDPSDFVLVLYKAKGCGYCDNIEKIWDDLSNIHKHTIARAIRKTYPSIKMEKVAANDTFGAFDYKKYPKGIFFFKKWFPMVLMIPSKVWKEGMDNLTKNPPVDLTRGTFILNGVIENGQILSKPEYNNMDVDDIMRWVKYVVQTKSKEMAMGNTDVPKKSFSKEGILPTEIKMNPIIKPLSNSGVKKEKKTKKEIDNVCSMNIIERP